MLFILSTRISLYHCTVTHVYVISRSIQIKILMWKVSIINDPLMHACLRLSHI
jgi:hypothetical protein